MKDYKKLHLKNDEDSDNLVDHLNKDWTIFKEFPGWVVMFKNQQLSEGALFEKLSKILSRPEVETMTIEQFEVLWNEAGGKLNASVSPAELRKPSNLPRKEWFETLKEPLRTQALEALEQFPDNEFLGMHFDGIDWDSTIQGGSYWDGAEDFFLGLPQGSSSTDYLSGWAIAKQCAPDGWEQQGAGE